MSKLVLKTVSRAMNTLGIEYGYVSYSKYPVIYPYYVGTYTEMESYSESGLQEGTFLLTGFTRDSWLTLENTREQIENYFNKISGKKVMAENGSAVAIFYAGSLIVPTGDAELKSIQINLSVKEWSV